jgi:hypothetical protein
MFLLRKWIVLLCNCIGGNTTKHTPWPSRSKSSERWYFVKFVFVSVQIVHSCSCAYTSGECLLARQAIITVALEFVVIQEHLSSRGSVMLELIQWNVAVTELLAYWVLSTC